MKVVLMSATYKALLMLTTLSLSVSCPADVWCTLTNFIVDAYDHGGAYVHGTLSGYGAATFVVLCGETNGAQDCTTQATDRRLAMALAGQRIGW
jgi:hypothetical protein